MPATGAESILRIAIVCGVLLAAAAQAAEPAPAVVGLLGERGAGIQTGVSNLIGGVLYIASEPGRPAQDWEDDLSISGRRSAGVDLDVAPATFAGGGKVDLRLRW